jgi:hypothetical protein
VPRPRYLPLLLVVGASISEVIELIHELISLDQELMTLDVGVPDVEAPVLVPVVFAVVLPVVEVVVAGGVLVLLLQAVPMLPIAMTAIIPAVAANSRARRRDVMASSLVVGAFSV